MASKYIVFSDLHLTNSNSNFKIGKDGVSDLLVAQERFVKYICEKYESGNYDGLIFAGDWTDSSTIDPIVQTYSNKCLSYMNDCSGFKLAITGNHTVYDKKNMFTIFGAAENAFGEINFINNKEVIEHGNIKFHCLPYNANYSKIEDAVRTYAQQLSDECVNILLFHFPLKGAALDNGLKSKDGVELLEKYFNKFDLCLGGDFHRRQNVLKDIYYIGAPFDLKFGEHMPRGALELSVEDDGNYDMNLIENPYQYNLLTYSEEVDKDVSERDVIRFKGDYDVSKKGELKEQVSGECYSCRFSVTNNNEDVDEVLDEFDSLSGGDNYDLIRNYLNNRDVSDDFLERCLKLMEQIV